MQRPSAEQVDEFEQWARALVRKGLALDLVDDKEFRKAVLMTARAGTSYVSADVGDTKLPKRTKMTSSCIPKLDAKLEAKVKKRVDALISETGALLISDGWTSVQSRPIINALLATPVGCRFLKAIDTSGSIKDAKYIADFLIACIMDVGPDKVTAVCMDGACTASFKLIQARVSARLTGMTTIAVSPRFLLHMSNAFSRQLSEERLFR